MMLRSFIALGLALMLALTSQSMAVARGASAATGQMVLCTGTGPVAVYLDATGEPTSAPHLCPDSALNIIVVGPALAMAAPYRVARFHMTTQMHGRPAPASVVLVPPSRGPPVFI